MEVQEAERRHIARELHDEIGQTLTAVKMSLQELQRANGGTAEGNRVTGSIEIIDSALHKVRDLSLDLRPSMLDDLGLVATLRWYVDHQIQFTGFTTKLDVDGMSTRPPIEIESACFRIVQEALTNVARHAQATRVEIELEDQDDGLRLLILDDGQGFDVNEALLRATRGECVGLLGMQERAALAGGRLKIEAGPGGRGTKIQGYFPLKTA